jgi:hypothetical protein
MDFIVFCYFYVHGNRLAVFRELFLCQRYLESSLHSYILCFMLTDKIEAFFVLKIRK